MNATILAILIVALTIVKAANPPIPGYGVLAADATHAASDVKAGFRYGQVDIGWNYLEPTEGSFSSSAISAIKTRLSALRSAGMYIALGSAIHYLPNWMNAVPGSNFTNQYGVNSRGPNVVFSQNVRNKVRNYLSQIKTQFGTNFTSVRIGFQPSAGELLFPDPKDSAGHSNSLWCFDNNAQKGGSDLPQGVSVCPFPGWIPGQSTYNGQPFTKQMANSYYTWYIQCLTKAGDWMQSQFQELGFKGKAEWLMPGSGMRPFDVDRYTTNLLTGTNGYDEYVAGTGAAWNQVIDNIKNKTNVRIQITSIADASGSPNANNCSSSDKNVSINSNVYAPWSDARWISYNANRYNLPKSGENPGPHDSVAVAVKANNLFHSCGLDVWYFSQDFSLYDGFSGAANISDMARIIKQHN